MFNVGDKFKRTYPFILVGNPTYDCHGMLDGIDDVWIGGCRKKDEGHTSEGGNGIVNYCDAVGFIEFEILTFVEMPRKYQDRVIYCVTMIDPDGEVKRKNKAHTVTVSKFNQWIKHSDAYVNEYFIEE